MRRDKCGGCGSGDLRQFLDLGETPLADDFPASVSAAAEQPRYPLGAAVCGACWLVQLTEVVPDDVLWGGEYGFYTGASPSSLAYFRAYADELRYRHPGRKFVVEVACNDGTMLEHFATGGVRTLGVEPAKGPAEAARARGLDVIEQPFGCGTAQGIVDAYGRADLIVANNVLAHVADLDDFVGGLALLLAPDGVLSVEVQYLGDLILGNGIDLLYHEHRSFFSVTTLHGVLSRHGLYVRDVQRTPAQGGSIRVTASASDEPVGPRLDAVGSEAWLRSSLTYLAMQGRARALRDRLCGLVATERATGRTVVGYGAPAKATTLLNWCGLGPDDVVRVHDATPSKNGRHIPGTGIPITTLPLDSTARELRGLVDGVNTTALLLAHNYLPGVLRREAHWLAAGGRFLVPMPVPVVI